MKFKIFVIVLIFLSFTAAPSFAYRSTESIGISDDTAIVIVWKTKGGYYRACGPVQRVYPGEKYAEDAIDYASNDSDNLSYVGMIGKYKVYSCNRPLKSYDTDARKCMK